MFLASITLPLVLTLFDVARGPGSRRDEQLARTPSAPTSLATALRWPGEFKWYFQQRFGLKQALIRLHGLVKVRLLGVSSNAGVLLGKSGWLFLLNDRVLDYQRHEQPFTDAELSDWVRVLKDRREWLAARNIEYLVVVAPNKHTVYPDRLPDDVAPPAARTRLDQLTDALSGRSQVQVLDLRSALEQARETGRVFHRTDTHWNLLGGWFATRAIVDRLGPQYTHDALGPTPGELTRTEERGGDLARLLGLADYMREESVTPSSIPDCLRDPAGNAVDWTPIDVLSRSEVIVETDAVAPRAVVFRDSSGEALIPWLSQCFGRTVWRWSYGFDRELIERERPGVVIQQFVERKLMTVVPNDEQPKRKP